MFELFNTLCRDQEDSPVLEGYQDFQAILGYRETKDPSAVKETLVRSVNQVHQDNQDLQELSVHQVLKDN